MYHASMRAVKATETKRKVATSALMWVRQFIFCAIHAYRTLRKDFVRNERAKTTIMPAKYICRHPMQNVSNSMLDCQCQRMFECADSDAMDNVNTVLSRVPSQCNADELFNLIQTYRIRVVALVHCLGSRGVWVDRNCLAFAALIRRFRGRRWCSAHRVRSGRFIRCGTNFRPTADVGLGDCTRFAWSGRSW